MDRLHVERVRALGSLPARRRPETDRASACRRAAASGRAGRVDGRTVYFTASGHTMASSDQHRRTLSASAPIERARRRCDGARRRRHRRRSAAGAPGRRARRRPRRAPHRPRMVSTELYQATVILVTSSTIRASPNIAHIADPDRLLELGLFVAEGRLVVRRLIDLQHWAIESILLTQPAADNLADMLPKTDAPIYVVEQDGDERRSPASTSIAAAWRWSGGRRRRRSIASRPARCRACWSSKA